MKFIPDDIDVNFMGARKVAFFVSVGLVIASVAVLTTVGLNQGIDFKGGSAVIAAFKADSVTERQAVADAMQGLIVDELGDVDTTVTVQDFDTGVGNAYTLCEDVPVEGGETRQRCETFQVDRFLLYTEVTSLIDAQRSEKIVEAIEEAFGEDTDVQTSAESDTFILTFAEPKPIPERVEALRELFGGDELGFENVRVSSDRERELDIQYLQERELFEQDASASTEDVPGAMAKTRDEHEADKAEMLAEETDVRFTVYVQELRTKVIDRFAAAFGDEFVDVESATTVSPSVGADLFANGMLALLYALIGILIYITVRFDFRYAPGAVIALFHDVIITMGIFAILQVKFSLPIIAALLTIIGYSLNDTIVVFDRVRETVNEFRGRGMLYMLNRAINGTLSRTVLTSGTTGVVVVVMLIFGGGTISDFALALFIGIIVGTYSSVYVASPLVYLVDQYLTRREAEAEARRKDHHGKGGGGGGGGGKKRAKATA